MFDRPAPPAGPIDLQIHVRFLLCAALLLGACRTADMDGTTRASTYHPYAPNYVAWHAEPDIDDQIEARLTFLYPWTKPLDFQRVGFETVQLYASYVARVSQVMKSQESSPVLGRRYNPEVFLRFWRGKEERSTDNYLDVAFGHESNGQAINSPDEFVAKQDSLVLDGDDPELARRNISRTWDYFALTWRHALSPAKERYAYVHTRYFLPGGVFSAPEDYFRFEASDEEQLRRRYDGLSLIYRDDQFLGGHSDFRAIYRTGYEDPFDNSTLRIEWTHDSDTWPITVFAQTGYMNDFATYYTHTTTFGVGVELR